MKTGLTQHVLRTGAEVDDGVACHAAVEGGFGVRDEVAVEVQGVMPVVVCWGRKVNLDALGEEQVKS